MQKYYFKTNKLIYLISFFMDIFIWAINLAPTNMPPPPTNKLPVHALSFKYTTTRRDAVKHVGVGYRFVLNRKTSVLGPFLSPLQAENSLSVPAQAFPAGRGWMLLRFASLSKVLFWDGTRRTKIFKVVRSSEKFDSLLSKKWIRKQFLCRNISAHFLVYPFWGLHTSLRVCVSVRVRKRMTRISFQMHLTDNQY